MKLSVLHTLITVCLLSLAGCSGVVRNALPYEEHKDASVLGQNNFRYWGDLSSFDATQYGFSTLPPEELRERYSGNTYDEMHVDGGAAAQMFLYPAGLDWDYIMDSLQVEGIPQAYLIRNSRIQAEYQTVEPKLSKIASRTIDSLIRTQGVGDAYRIYAISERDGVDVRLTWIPSGSVEDTSNEMFDPDYMSMLFEYGYQRALNGELWTELKLN